MLLRQNERQSLFAEVDSAFRGDVLKGLGTKPRAIPARWLYDRRGSELFEAITALPEYYPTRTERSILSCAVSEIAALIGPKRAVVEFGSGSSTKTPILLSEVSPAAWRFSRATGCPRQASRSPWLMPATNSGLSYLNSVTDVPFFSAR
jgi:L-histidine N-alpha-methyltransferase